MRVAPHIEILVQDQKLPPQLHIANTVEIPEYVQPNKYLTVFLCGLSTLLPYLLKQPVLEFLAMLKTVGKRHIVSVAIVPVSTRLRTSLPLRQGQCVDFSTFKLSLLYVPPCASDFRARWLLQDGVRVVP